MPWRVPDEDEPMCGYCGSVTFVAEAIGLRCGVCGQPWDGDEDEDEDAEVSDA